MHSQLLTIPVTWKLEHSGVSCSQTLELTSLAVTLLTGVPDLVRSKIGTVRKSYHFSGNAKDYVAEFTLPMKEGSSTKLWMDYEEYRHMLKVKEECEMYYWYGAELDDQGANKMLDENGQPVISGPGLFEQIINKDTYSTLTQKKLEDTIGDLFYGMTTLPTSR